MRFLLALLLVIMGFAPVQVPMKELKAFLALPVSHTLRNQLSVSEGWVYSEDEHSIHPTFPTHFAADIPLPWGTPVYAPADGLAEASYHTYDMTDAHGRVIGYGLGLFVAIWHPQAGVYTAYCHLSAINTKLVPYLKPTQIGSNWQPVAALYVPVETFKRSAKPVKRGDLIGYVGYTGLRNGYPETPGNPVTVDPAKDKTWDPHGAHLHWEVYTRTENGGKKDRRYDPFGIYGQREQYTDVFKKATGLIEADAHGAPLFAH